MEHAFAELPLAVFTTLAPISAGAFIPLAIAFLTTRFSDDQLKRIDAFTWIPLVLLIVGFVAAFFHLTQVLQAVHVLSGAGRSPMSNEIIAGAVFFVVALAYCILAAAGKLSGNLRKTLSIAAALTGLCFTLSVGMAYMIESIVSWNTVLVPLEVLGFSLLGGGLLGLLPIVLGKGLPEVRKTGFKATMLAVLAIGLALGAGCAVAHVGFVGGITTLLADGSLIVEEAMAYLVIAVIGLVLAALCGGIALIKGDAAIMPVIAVALAAIAIFLARLVFYALQISVAL